MRLKKITALFLTGALILSMAGCAGNGSKDKKEGSAGNEAQEPVKIATKPMTEQFILGEMLKKLIEEKAGYEVELTKGIGGGTSNIQPAMEKGEFDLYPEYTSSGWILVIGHKAGEDMLGSGGGFGSACFRRKPGLYRESGRSSGDVCGVWISV